MFGVPTTKPALYNRIRWLLPPLLLLFIPNVHPPFIHLPLLLQQVQRQFLYLRQQPCVHLPRGLCGAKGYVYTFGEYAARNLQGAGALKWERMPEQYQHGQQHKNYCCNAPKKIYLTKICGTNIETAALGSMDNQIVRTWAGYLDLNMTELVAIFLDTSILM
jgi:hypothetical protein